MRRIAATVVSIGLVGLLACALDTTGTAVNGAGFVSDASADAISPPPPPPTKTDGGFVLPVEDGGPGVDSGVGLDAASGPDAPVCVGPGEKCSRQIDCCARAFCARQYIWEPFACHACQRDGTSCGNDVECCSQKCEWSWASFSNRCAQ